MPDPTAPRTGEDAFFVLRYCREHLQRRLVEVAHQCGITSASLLDAFSKEIGEAHDELASQNKPAGFDETAGLTASRISLVGNDDLELEIRIGELISHLKNNDNIDHWRVQLRYMTLLNRRDMPPEQNPVGFEPLNRGLWVICHESGFTLEQDLVFLDRLEEMLQLRLPEIYIELSGLLEHHRVEPAQVSILQRPSSPRKTNAAVGGAMPASNALASLRQALSRQSETGGASQGNISAIPYSGGGGDAASNAVLNASAMVMLGHLMERLNTLEAQQLASNLAGSTNAPLHALRAKDLDLPLGGSASIAMDTLSMIFEAIFTTPDLPDSVKTAIGRLQIPLLKRAILDPSFFNDAQHPARLAINRLARAAIGLPRDTRHDHPVCMRLAEIADAVRSELEADGGDITGQLDALVALIDERDRSTQSAAGPYVELVREHEAREVASTQAQSWLRQILQTPMPQAIADFFSQEWLRAMEAAHRSDAGTGERWKSFETVTKDLLWSIQPKQTAEDRKDLMLLIPALLKRINAGLDLAGVSTEERKPFLDACFDLQTAALRNRSASVPPAIAATNSAAGQNPSSTRPTVLALANGSIRVRYLGLSTADSWRSKSVPQWKEGDWIRFQMSDGEYLCGRLCWEGAPYGTALVFNPVWGHAVAVAPSLLEQQFRAKQAEIASDIQLFDEAATRALGQFRPA